MKYISWLLLLCIVINTSAKQSNDEFEADLNWQQVLKVGQNLIPQVEDKFLGEQSVAVCTYYNSINSTGWNFLQIVTSQTYSDNDQHQAAGFCEGALTHDQIYSAYVNFQETVLIGELPQKAQEFISAQIYWIDSQINQFQATNPYWQIVDNLMHQIRGMHLGYLHAINQLNITSTRYLDFDHFYYLTNMGDLEDLAVAFKNQNQTVMECDAYVRFNRLNRELICGHSTFNIYSLMLRIHQSYFFNFNNAAVANFNMTFTSRPGDLQSKDDFYTLDKNLVVLETSLNNYNSSNYNFLKNNTLPCWIRLSVANRLSKTPAEWAKNFQFQRSGTHNNQWLIVDYNSFRKQRKTMLFKPLKNIVLMIEESFYLFSVTDMTSMLQQNGYVASFNTPYNQTIYDWTNYRDGQGYDWNTAPRNILFKQYQSMGQSTEGVKKLLRYNNNQTDTCVWSLAPRCQLKKSQPQMFGAIDAKVIDQQLLDKGQVWMISGPTKEQNLPTFDFSQYQNFSRLGMPDQWDFEWIKWNYNH